MIPAHSLEAFSRTVESLLTDWNFPDGIFASFDAPSADLVVGGKPRGARGAGLRAITHAAFSLGLVVHCRTAKTSHPGFVVLDSPLIAYRRPEGADDDLRGHDLKDRFYRTLSTWPEDRQVLVVEHQDPPDDLSQQRRDDLFQ